MGNVRSSYSSRRENDVTKMFDFSFFFLIFQVTNNSILLFTLLRVASIRSTLLRLRPRLPEILFHAKNILASVDQLTSLSISFVSFTLI